MRYNAQANRIIEEAILCKLFKCSPDDLDEMDWDKVETFKEVYTAMAKDNPMSLLI